MGAIERAYKTEPKLSYDSLYHNIASQIGDSVSPKRVEDVVNMSNGYGHIVHGVRSSQSLKSVKTEGIKPLTPEGGFISCWTSGTRIFAGSTKETPLQFFDTTFFHYAPSYDRRKGISRMVMALTNPDLIKREDIVVANNQVDLKTRVPRDEMALLIVEGNRKHNIKSTMFDLLESTMKSGYLGGELKLVKL